MVSALGCGERGMGKQLLLIRHGLKQRSQIGLHPRGSPTKVRKLSPQGLNTPDGPEGEGTEPEASGTEAQAKQQPTTQQRNCAPNGIGSQGRFPHPRAVFDQQMTAGQQTTEGQAHDGLCPAAPGRQPRSRATAPVQPRDHAKHCSKLTGPACKHPGSLSPRQWLARMHWRSKPRREPKPQL